MATNKANKAARMIAAKAVTDLVEKRRATKTRPPSRSKLSYPNKSKAAIAASTHRDVTLNEWDPEDMRMACQKYKAQQMDHWPQNQPKLSLRFSLNCNLNLNFKYISSYRCPKLQTEPLYMCILFVFHFKALA